MSYNSKSSLLISELLSALVSIFSSAHLYTSSLDSGPISSSFSDPLPKSNPIVISSTCLLLKGSSFWTTPSLGWLTKCSSRSISSTSSDGS